MPYKKTLTGYCKHCKKETLSSERKVVRLGKYSKQFYICLECGNPYAYNDWQELARYLVRSNKKGRKTFKYIKKTKIENPVRDKTKKIAGFYKGTYGLYLQTDHWLELRDRKMKRNPICEMCKNAEATEVHHIRYVDDSGKSILYREKLKDLVSLCHNCHKKIHGY